MAKWCIMFLGFLCLVQMGCSIHQHPSRTRSDVLSCQAQCLQIQTNCNQQCENGCLQCVIPADASAKRHHGQYVRQQVVQGGFIARDVSSYRDPLQCVKNTCNCRADFNQCAQACTGTIYKRLQSPLRCC